MVRVQPVICVLVLLITTVACGERDRPAARDGGGADSGFAPADSAVATDGGGMLDAGMPSDGGTSPDSGAPVDAGEGSDGGEPGESYFRATLQRSDESTVILDGTPTERQTRTLFSCFLQDSDGYKVSLDIDPTAPPSVGSHDFVGASRKPYLTVGWPTSESGFREIRVLSGSLAVEVSLPGIISGTFGGVSISDPSGVVVGVSEGAFLCRFRPS